jgi:hypothetical protein
MPLTKDPGTKQGFINRVHYAFSSPKMSLETPKDPHDMSNDEDPDTSSDDGKLQARLHSYSSMVCSIIEDYYCILCDKSHL